MGRCRPWGGGEEEEEEEGKEGRAAHVLTGVQLVANADPGAPRQRECA